MHEAQGHARPLRPLPLPPLSRKSGCFELQLRCASWQPAGKWVLTPRPLNRDQRIHDENLYWCQCAVACSSPSPQGAGSLLANGFSLLGPSTETKRFMMRTCTAANALLHAAPPSPKGLQEYMGAKVHGCKNAWVQKCMGPKMHGCKNACVQKCMGAKMHGRMRPSFYNEWPHSVGRTGAGTLQLLTPSEAHPAKSMRRRSQPRTQALTSCHRGQP